MRVDIYNQRILILDFGSQFSELIAKRIRKIGLYCQLVSADVENDYISEFAPNGIILSGGPHSVIEEHKLMAPSLVFELGCPVLGICYGMQVMAFQLGGQVAHGVKSEFGQAQVRIVKDSPLLHGIEDHIDLAGDPILDVWMSHGDHVSHLPKGFVKLAETKNSPHAIMADLEKQFYGLQFHPEVIQTKQGQRILSQFVLSICGCSPNWNTPNVEFNIIEYVKKQVNKDQVILGLSGGVDSAVVAALLNKAIGNQLLCVFVDTGLLRFEETNQLQNVFKKHFGLRLITIDAREAFYNALKGITGPEEKRRLIGRLFVSFFEKEAKKYPSVKWLAQGTIYSDIIESAHSKTGHATLIKSHHNVGGLPEKMSLKLMEPLKNLFKDEVRELGLTLGLPYEIVYRHPFPGPGLAIRILGEINKERISTLQQADAIFIEELKLANLYNQISQALALLLPIKTVAVKGDKRDYGYVIALRAVVSTDFMTATWADLPTHFLRQVSTRIVNEIQSVSRVVYDISDKPPATIEWE